MKEEKASVSHSEKGCPGNTEPEHQTTQLRHAAASTPSPTMMLTSGGRQSITFIHTFKGVLLKDLPAPTGHNL